jgi:GNAT superfamily N-acetyltransferase
MADELNIEYENIVDNLGECKPQVIEFINNLGTEVEFFPITIDLIMRSDYVLIARHNLKIIGLIGLEKPYYRILKTYILINKNYQGKGIGKALLMKEINDVKDDHCVIMAHIEHKNIKSITMFNSFGFKHIGKKMDLEYFIKPFNPIGYCLYYTLKFLFPVVRRIAT